MFFNLTTLNDRLGHRCDKRYDIPIQSSIFGITPCQHCKLTLSIHLLKHPLTAVNTLGFINKLSTLKALQFNTNFIAQNVTSLKQVSQILQQFSHEVSIEFMHISAIFILQRLLKVHHPQLLKTVHMFQRVLMCKHEHALWCCVQTPPKQMHRQYLMFK